MDSKKGIRIKTKQPTFVDNIFNMFKPAQLTPNSPPESQNTSQIRDASPRSTTPRKKIFDKTPQKNGKIHSSNLNSKSMDAAYEITFNHQINAQNDHRSNSQLSPPKKFTKNRAFEDTQFNKLILGHSQVSNKKSLTPEKTFLSDVPSNHSINQPEKGSTNFKKIQAPQHRQVEKQLEHHKRLLKECIYENDQLKSQNRGLKEEIQNLRKVIKSYELSNASRNGVQIVNLEPESIKSPLEKVSPFSAQIRTPIQTVLQDQKSFQHKEKKRQQMKQSIPIMPEIPNEYNENERGTKIGEISYLSSDLKNRSHEGSFLESEKSYENLPGFSMHSDNQNIGVRSPLEKTVYDKTMKPQERDIKAKAKQQKEQISFSKTIGYIKGDQPLSSNNQGAGKKNNPFEDIATESNKYLFQNGNQPSALNNHQSASNNSLRVDERNSKGFNGRNWVVFNQGPNSLGYSSNSNSISSMNRKSVSPDKVVFDQSKSNRMPSPRQQHSVTEKLKIQASKTYKFQDFDPNDDESSYVDYF